MYGFKRNEGGQVEVQKLRRNVPAIAEDDADDEDVEIDVEHLFYSAHLYIPKGIMRIATAISAASLLFSALVSASNVIDLDPDNFNTVCSSMSTWAKSG